MTDRPELNLDGQPFYDSELVTADPWPLPAVKPWNPTPRLTVWQRLCDWLAAFGDTAGER